MTSAGQMVEEVDINVAAISCFMSHHILGPGKKDDEMAALLCGSIGRAPRPLPCMLADCEPGGYLLDIG